MWKELQQKIVAEHQCITQIVDKYGVDFKAPIIALAPMADVTDVSFRTVIAENGMPDVLWTEFVSADGLIRATPKGKQKLLADLKYSEIERPIVAQLFGSHIEHMKQAAYMVAELGFDGIDINMGCPSEAIEKQGAGAAHIRNPEHAQNIIRAAQQGVREYAEKKSSEQGVLIQPIPISVKTRIGYNTVEIDSWLRALIEVVPAVVTIHARTRKEMSKVPARWEFVQRAVEIRNEMNAATLIFGNGDVVDRAQAFARAYETGADGVMIGRGIFGNPWLFKKHDLYTQGHVFDTYVPEIEERISVLKKHTMVFEKELEGYKSFDLMKKHFKAYLTGFDGAKELREKLMETKKASDALATMDEYVINILNKK